MEIRNANETDIDQILNLQTQIYRTDKISENAHATLTNQLKDQTCDVLVLVENGKIIGTGTIYYIQVAIRAKPYAFLEGLVIDKSLRGKGYGTKLFQKCVEIARQKNCYKMLFTSGTDRTEAHKFYENLGFKKWGLEFRMDL